MTVNCIRPTLAANRPLKPADAATDATDDVAASFAAEVKRNASPASKMDVTKLPFKIVFECKADAASAGRFLAKTGWSVSAISGSGQWQGDCSHSTDGGAHQFVRLHSPALTLAEGGLESVGRVIDLLGQHKVSLGFSSAMRILVDAAKLDDGTVSNLVGLHLSNEDILYRLGQGGWSGRPIALKTRGTGAGLGNEPFARALSTQISKFSAQSKAHWARTLSHQYNCMNSQTSGWWEFRWFDSSLERPAVQANACLLMGLISAAADDRGTFSGHHKIADYDKQVSRDRWTALIKSVAGTGSLARQLERQFRAAGGKLEMTDRTTLDFFASLGAAFQDPASTKALSTAETLGVLAAGQTVAMQLGKFHVRLTHDPKPGAIAMDRASAFPEADWRQAAALDVPLDGPPQSPVTAAHCLQVQQGCTVPAEGGTERLAAVAAAGGQPVTIRFPGGLQTQLALAQLQPVAQLAATGDPEEAGARGIMAAYRHLQHVITAPGAPMEVLAAVYSKVALQLQDPAGLRRTIQGEDELLRTAADLQSVGQNLTAQQTEDLREFGQLIGNGVAAGFSLPNQTDRPVQDASAVPWVFHSGGTLRLGSGAASVTMRDWERLHHVIAVESGKVTPPALEIADSLTGSGVRFSDKGSLRTLLAESLEHGTAVVAEVPRWIWWRGWFHKKVTVRGTPDLERLRHKLGVSTA